MQNVTETEVKIKKEISVIYWIALPIDDLQAQTLSIFLCAMVSEYRLKVSRDTILRFHENQMSPNYFLEFFVC